MDKPQDDGEQQESKGSADNSSKSGLRAVAAVAVVAIVAVFAWVLFEENDSGSDGDGAAKVVSVTELRDEVGGGTTPVYWAGERSETEIELSQPDPSRTYVRYLTEGAEAGDERAEFLTIGTYVHANAVEALEEQGKEPGGEIVKAPGNATVFFNRESPHSVYVAFPGVDVEIEVFDPDFTRALQLVNSGQILPVG